jgi:hypothetical protein
MSTRISPASRAALQASLVALLLVTGAASATDATTPAPAAEASPSESTVINLIRLMVKRGLLSQAEADGLLKQAQAEADAAKAAAKASAAPPSLASAPADMAPGSVFVPYVPQAVKDELREQVKNDVMDKARAEKWASPDAAPDWTRRLTLSGDLRLRDESDYYDSDNAIAQVDYAAFNAAQPDLLANPPTVPLQNTSEDRQNILRLRARLGLAINIADEVSAGVRIGTGSNTSPVSTNQTLGGGFGKKDLWLDRAWIDLHPWQGVRFLGGRMPNPFLSTELIYDEDLNFDGVATRLSRLFDEDHGISGFGTLGAFPLQIGSDRSAATARRPRSPKRIPARPSGCSRARPASTGSSIRMPRTA